MTPNTQIFEERTLDSLLSDIEALKKNEDVTNTITKYLDGDYKAILRNNTSQELYEVLSRTVSLTHGQQDAALQDAHLDGVEHVVPIFLTGLAAFNAFLQANVTGPPLDLRDVFATNEKTDSLRDRCLKSLDMDGVSVYQHIPHVELFCLARLVFTVYFPRLINGIVKDSRWMRIRINVYHQRLLTGLSGGRLSDSTALQDAIEKDVLDLEAEILGVESTYSTETKVQFLLEKAQIYIMQGLDLKAKKNVKMAKTFSGFTYALSGALGKRTKFQQTDISQLVVFAKSREADSQNATGKESKDTLKDAIIENNNAPEALNLNDDTLLESIAFKKPDSEAIDSPSLPPELAGLQPDAQPQLQPLDQIALLTEATLKDSLSPLDKLNSEEILPYAVRVLNDKPTNWQIYTQALLVRSRIEAHRSRTQERSVLQLQVIVDQIIADTQEEAPTSSASVPEIRITSFLPAPKPSESAPITERLRYIYPLNTPTRWELETELAYAWSAAGSLISALEIFKRLKLWAEVALCYHSVGQESKARQIVRRQLYYSSSGPDKDSYPIDAPELVTEQWDGELRPTPRHAPRLWCILGDLDQDLTCWQRAWEISGKRYARAQRTLGEYYTKQGNLPAARKAYMAATVVNRQNNETWSRLGDIDLAVGNWDGAVIAFQQSIMIDDTDAKTYSNLGSALLSKHAEMMKAEKAAAKDTPLIRTSDEDDDEEVNFNESTGPTPQDILHQALLAYKRGASLAHSNWKIWDNVLTIALRSTPPSFPDLLIALRAIVALRSPSIGEEAVDIDVLSVLVHEVISRDRLPGNEHEDADGIYVPPRGSLARATLLLMDEITPLITKRFVLYHLVEKLALYSRDYVNALGCAEKAWRMSQGEGWLEDGEMWREVVTATDHLVSAYESYGPMEKRGGGEVEAGWRGKARSAVRGVMGRARGVWEGSEEWEVLVGRLEELKS